MKAVHFAVKSAHEWLYPDDHCECSNQFMVFPLHIARNSSDAIQVLLDEPWSALTDATLLANSCHNECIEGEILALLPVYVEKNTGIEGYTATSEPTPYVTKKAPFYVYDVVAPLGQQVFSLLPQRCALYIRFTVSDSCCPETYPYILTVKTSSGQLVLKIVLHIYPALIPHERSLCISNWFDLNNIAIRHSLTLWSDEYWEMVERYIALMAHVRQTHFLLPFFAIDAHLRHDQWQFSFLHAQRLLSLYEKHGMQCLECGPIAFQLFLGDHHFRLISDHAIMAVSTAGLSFIEAYYQSLHHFLSENHLLERCVLHVADEPHDCSIPEYEFVAQRIKNIFPNTPLMDAVCTSALQDVPDIQIPDAKRYELDHAKFSAIQRDRSTWFYTCAIPGGYYCNRLIDLPLIKTRLLCWGNAYYGLSGYLHWGFNCYRAGQDAFVNLSPRFSAVREERFLPPGDTHLVYPGACGPLASVRLEQLKKGVEDYELLRSLKQTDVRLAQTILYNGFREFSKTCCSQDFSLLYQTLLTAGSSSSENE